ncbi:hypothetical protein HYH03_003111 [Edaphochlamys debaryana]|uniref:Uncharacterized protein n=1 Tax=Edaphochlamys debaryana TaxID=47281 RepID=A0A835YDM1_9CHLO|nr:hypothetical protein HYH03_003111 [Edaphochlamys debaryana]|eukprot:KAG2498921.1 hypothetical protein HYH03_003111 [Edaphochlamys debaryana]
MASKVVPSVTGTTEGLERPAANGGPRVAWAAAISSRDPAPGPKEGARASQPPPPPLPVIHSPASAKLASASKGTGAGGGWGLFRGHHAAQHAARSGRGSATAVLAASAMAGTLRRQQKARALGSVGANTWGPGAAERRGVRARGGEEKMRLQEKLWTKLRDAKELPGIRGWAFRRGLPILGATLFVVDVVSDAVLAKNLFGNGYTRLGTLTLVFMLAHYVPTYFMILRAANQSFYAAHVLLLSGSTAGAAPGAAGDASAASAASASALPAIGAVARRAGLHGQRLQEAIHLFFYVLLVIFGLLLVPFIDVYMVLSAFVLSVDHGDAGYTMRTAEDFCRQYERARLPLECFLESLPQTALQVVLTVSLLGSVCNLILVSWEMYNAWRSSGDTFLEYLDPLIRLQGSTKVPIEAQNAMLERVAEHVRRVEERERSDAASGGGNGTGGGSSSDSGPPGGGGALVPLPSRKRGSGSGLPNGAAGADCDSGSEDEIEDEAWERADQAPGHRSLRAISFLEKVDPSAAAAARARGLPPSLVFVLGGAGDHIYSSLSAFQRRSLMDVLSSYSKVRLPALRALQMQQVDPSVASRLLRKVVALPPHLRLVGGGQGRRGGGGNLIPPSFYNIVVQVLPQAALEVHPEAPMLDLQLSKLVLTGQYTSSASGSSLQAYSNSVAVGWALAQVLIAQPQLCRVLLDECDVYVPAMLDALDKELEAEAEYRARAPVTETKAAVTAADLEAAARAAAAEAAAGACEGSGDGDETTVQPSARHAPDVMKAALAAAAMMRASAAARGMEEPASGDATAEGAPVPDGRLVRLAQYAALARLREAAGPRLLVVVHPEGGSEIEKRLEERARRGGALQQPLHAAGDRKPAAQRPGASGELRELHLVPSYRPRGMNIDSKVLLVPCPRSPALLSMLSSALSAVLAPSRLVLSHSDLHAEDCASIGATLAFNRSIETLELQATGLGVEALAHMLPGLQVRADGLCVQAAEARVQT